MFWKHLGDTLTSAKSGKGAGSTKLAPDEINGELECLAFSS